MINATTSGGLPIFYNVGGRNHGYKSRVLYECSADPRHKLTKNQARSNGFYCTHCRNPLKARAHKVQELEAMAKSLGATIQWK